MLQHVAQHDQQMFVALHWKTFKLPCQTCPLLPMLVVTPYMSGWKERLAGLEPYEGPSYDHFPD
jgi:hypothetical protein